MILCPSVALLQTTAKKKKKKEKSHVSIQKSLLLANDDYSLNYKVV